jgi:hypothetical protein
MDILHIRGEWRVKEERFTRQHALVLCGLQVSYQQAPKTIVTSQ